MARRRSLRTSKGLKSDSWGVKLNLTIREGVEVLGAVALISIVTLLVILVSR